MKSGEGRESDVIFRSTLLSRDMRFVRLEARATGIGHFSLHCVEFSFFAHSQYGQVEFILESVIDRSHASAELTFTCVWRQAEIKPGKGTHNSPPFWYGKQPTWMAGLCSKQQTYLVPRVQALHALSGPDQKRPASELGLAP